MQAAAEYVQEAVSEPVKKGTFSYVTGCDRPDVPDFLIVSNRLPRYRGVICTKFPPAILEVEGKGKSARIKEFNCPQPLTHLQERDITAATLAFVESLSSVQDGLCGAE
jgi:hypothetical protein